MHGTESVNAIKTELLDRFGRIQAPNYKGARGEGPTQIGRHFTSSMELNRGRAYNKYKERFFKLTNNKYKERFFKRELDVIVL